MAAYYSPLTRFWELGLGCILATTTATAADPVGAQRALAAGLGVALLVVSLWTLDASSVYPGWRAWLPCASTALFIWAGAGGGRSSVTRLLSTRPVGYVGDLCLSLYLAHYPWIELTKQASSWSSSCGLAARGHGRHRALRPGLVPSPREPRATVTQARRRPGRRVPRARGVRGPRRGRLPTASAPEGLAPPARGRRSG